MPRLDHFDYEWTATVRPDEQCLGVVDGCDADRKLELILANTPSGAARLELRQVVWDEGLGWYRQQTLQLPLELAEMEGLISRARGTLAGPSEAQARAKVVELRAWPRRSRPKP